MFSDKIATLTQKINVTYYLWQINFKQGKLWNTSACMNKQWPIETICLMYNSNGLCDAHICHVKATSMVELWAPYQERCLQYMGYRLCNIDGNLDKNLPFTVCLR